MRTPLGRTTTTVVSALLVLGGGLTACGGDDGGDSPDDASKDDFCKAVNSIADVDADASNRDQVEAAKEAAGRLQDAGTPEDIPDEAREGFESVIDRVNGLDDDASEKDFEKLFSEDDKAYAALSDYILETCVDADTGDS